MTICCVWGCHNKPKKGSGITYHRFPTRNALLREKWINAVRRKDWTPKSWDVVCSKHFHERDMDRTSLCNVRLRENVVPELFPSYPQHNFHKTKKVETPPAVRIADPKKTRIKSGVKAITAAAAADNELPPPQHGSCSPSIPSSMELSQPTGELPHEVSSSLNPPTCQSTGSSSPQKEVDTLMPTTETNVRMSCDTPRKISLKRELEKVRGQLTSFKKKLKVTKQNIKDLLKEKEQFMSLLQSPAKPRTPTKNQSPRKSSCSFPTRSSPRKRLYMPDSPPSPLNSPNKSRPRINCQLIKRQRTQRRPQPLDDLNLSLKGLSHDQLIAIVTTIVQNNPPMKDEILALVPLPDLSPLEDRLIVLRRNISSAFPRTRLVSRGDAFCYHRVLTHLNTFKKECLEQSRSLLSSKQWSSVVDYVMLAWSYVDRLPNWDCPSHNKIKQICFSALASHCMTALKAGNFDTDHLEEIAERLKEAEVCSVDIGPCVSYVSKLITNATLEVGVQVDLVN